jgi:hypothetical protein
MYIIIIVNNIVNNFVNLSSTTSRRKSVSAFFQLAVDKILRLLQKFNGQCIRVEIFARFKFFAHEN